MIPTTKGRLNNIGTQTPVMPNGNSWVICDSKSRPGFKYYFNTESGEAVWNLSNKDQIEKAKKDTHLLHTRLGIVPELPEPKDQPPLNAQKNFNLQMSNFCNLLNVGSRSFNGNVWANPPGVVQQPQIVLVPTIAPMVNPSMGNNNLNPALALQNALPFTYQNFGNYNVPYNNTDSGKVPFNHSNNYREKIYKNKQFNKRQRHQGENSTRQDTKDLRQKLARKRSHSESNQHSLPYTKGHFNSDSMDYEDNSPTNECNSEYPDYQATEQIENKTTTDTFKLDNCYVVVDKDIIVSEFVFLDNLVSNDPNFHLVVPQHVISELETQACKNGEARVRRIVRFLSQKIESRLVYLGDEIEENSLPNWEKTFVTCEKLVENYETNVILISNNTETTKLKGNNDKIRLMSMCEFKDMLSKTKIRFSPTRQIKIVVPNNFKIHEKTNANDSISINERIETNENNEAIIEKKDRSLQSPLPITSPPSKQTVDTAVQTEIDTEGKEIRLGTNIVIDTTMTNETTRKKREIRLNRTTPMKKAHHSNEEPSSDKKTFKWRKNRATSYNSNNSKPTKSTSNVSSEPTNIASNTAVNYDMDIIPNITVRESYEKEKTSKENTNKENTSKENSSKENTSQTFTDSFAMPKTNSVKSSIIEREQAKATSNVPEKGTNIHNDRKTSTESWIESLPNSRSDAGSKSSSHRSEIKKKSSISTSANNVVSVVHKVPVKPMIKNIVFKNVEMITITGPSMEEVLRIRSDEWVSRFVQIMEEILKEKLQENPPFVNDEYPPPWNLCEATKCIIKKYSDYFNVVNAANKLSFILYKISEEKDKIPLTLEPSDFMEMYSYGVYLVETLQDVSSNCDELRAAKESLKRLLHDIQNANSENSCSELFGDELQESYMKYATSTNIPEPDFGPSQEQSTPKKITQNRCTTRSNANKKLEAKTTSEIPETSLTKSSSIDKKTNFLSNLKLITRSISSPSTITSPAYSNLTVRSPINSSTKSPVSVAPKITDENDTLKNKELINSKNNKSINSKNKELIHSKNKEPINSKKEESIKHDEEIVSSSSQPSFVRNFQVCPEFEARINKARSILEQNYFDDTNTDDYYCDDDDNEFNMIQFENSVPKDISIKHVPVRYVNNSEKKEMKFRWSFGDSQLRDVKETFADVINKLSLTTCDPSKIEESKSIAMRIFPYIENIYNSLDITLKNNSCYSDANIKELLKNVNADSMEEEMFCMQYRNTITQFRDQAYVIIKYLKIILSTS